MKLHYSIGIVLICMMLVLNGCGNTGEVVEEEELSGGSVSVETEPTEEMDIVSQESEKGAVEEEEEVDVKELIEQLSEEAGLDAEESDDSSEEDEDTESSSTVKEVSIENFKGNPDDFTIKAGTVVKWTNNMDNFRHEIEIYRQKNDSNKFETHIINDDGTDMLHGDSYEYTFEEAWTYRWMSRTKRDKVNGIITVTE